MAPSSEVESEVETVQAFGRLERVKEEVILSRIAQIAGIAIAPAMRNPPMSELPRRRI